MFVFVKNKFKMGIITKPGNYPLYKGRLMEPILQSNHLSSPIILRLEIHSPDS